MIVHEQNYCGWTADVERRQLTMTLTNPLNDVWYARCDVCDTTIDYVEDAVTAQRWADAAGWRWDGGYLICEVCQARRRTA